jgi:hypothetical protein
MQIFCQKIIFFIAGFVIIVVFSIIFSESINEDEFDPMTADLMASGSLEEGSPLNGTVLASCQLAYKAITAEMSPSPSLKINSDIRAVNAGGTIDFDVKTINSTAYKITAVICQKGEDWDHTSTVMNEIVLKNIDAAVSSNTASPTSIPLSFTAAELSSDQSYMLVVYIKDSNDDIVMTVP